MFDILTGFVNVKPLEDKHSGKSDDAFLIVIVDFTLSRHFWYCSY